MLMKTTGAWVLTFALLLCMLAVPPAWGDYLAEGDVVTDTATGLMWMKSDQGALKNWTDALSHCEDLTLGGYSDWRLPDIKELESLIDLDQTDPCIDPVFACHSTSYWSSSPFALFNDAWRIDFKNAVLSRTGMETPFYIRCVRGGP